MLLDMNPRFLLLIGTYFCLQTMTFSQDTCNVDGGVINFENQDTVMSICVGSGMNNEFDVLIEGALGDSQVWVVVDQDLILSMQSGNTFDLEGNDVGNCFISSVSYTGDLAGLDVGNHLDSLEGCYSLSNMIRLIKSASLDGGMIAPRDSAQTIEFCAGSQESREVEVELSGHDGKLSTWLVTDTALNILEVPIGPPFDFSSLPPGICRLWHMSHVDGVSGVEEGKHVDDIVGCYTLSNAIDMVKSELLPPNIYTRDTLYELSFCPGDSLSMSVEILVEKGEGEHHVWVVTDIFDNLLMVLDSPPLDLSLITEDVCEVYAITYNGELDGLEIGLDLPDLTGCFSISNKITVYKSGVDGGRIFLPGNQTQATICLEDNLNELKFPIVSGAIGTHAQWLITDKNGYITDLPERPPFSFENQSPDTCLIWHMSYEGEVENLSPGQHTDNLSGCFDLSNLIAIIKAEVKAGSVLTRDSLHHVEMCALARDTTPIEVYWEDGQGEENIWVITDEEGIITDLPDGPPFYFDQGGRGLRFIYLMTSSGPVDGLELHHAVEDIEGCFTLSEPIVVNINGGAEAGFISTSEGETELTICIDEVYSDTVTVEITGESDYVDMWIITDEEGLILDLPAGPVFTFEGAGPGTCFIYYLQYVDTIDGVFEGGFIDEIVGCYDLSNPILVDRKVNACASEHIFEHGHVSNVGSEWIEVPLNKSYESMVVVATPVLQDILQKPAVTRIRNASGTSFELSVQTPGAASTPAIYHVQYVVVEEGVYKEELDGINMEAHRWNSSKTSRKGDFHLEPRAYENDYDDPIVLGQVMSSQDDRWSVFWSSQSRRKILPPNRFNLSASRHIGEDIDLSRSDEMLGVIIIEQGVYEVDGFLVEANVTPKAIRGVDDTNVGFEHETQVDQIRGGVLSSFGMRGSNFGWPILLGEDPFEGNGFHTAIDEDQISDIERRHPKEEVAYIVIGQGSAPPPLISEINRFGRIYDSYRCG